MGLLADRETAGLRVALACLVLSRWELRSGSAGALTMRSGCCRYAGTWWLSMRLRSPAPRPPTCGSRTSGQSQRPWPALGGDPRLCRPATRHTGFGLGLPAGPGSSPRDPGSVGAGSLPEHHNDHGRGPWTWGGGAERTSPGRRLSSERIPCRGSRSDFGTPRCAAASPGAGASPCPATSPASTADATASFPATPSADDPSLR